MPSLTTHVLDISLGRPAAGLTVRLERFDQAGWTSLAEAATDADGRVRDWLPDGVPAGRYRLVFETGAWFAGTGRVTLYPSVLVDCDLKADQPYYHIPLLLAPFGFSTYRGT